MKSNQSLKSNQLVPSQNIMDDKDKIDLIKDLMTNPVYAEKIDDEAMRELVREIIVHNGTAEEFFKVNYNVDLDEMRNKKELSEAEKKVFMSKD